MPVWPLIVLVRPVGFCRLETIICEVAYVDAGDPADFQSTVQPITLAPSLLDRSTASCIFDAVENDLLSMWKV